MLSASTSRPARWLPWLILVLAAYVPVFHQLDTEAIKTFDESLFALRAYHLTETGEYLNNFKELPGGPSATNLKTPLFTGIQALSFSLFGYSELALRIPVALMVLVLMGLMIYAGKQVAGAEYGWISCMILLASWGFFHVHAARSGDHDVPLSAFLFLSAWALYQYLETCSSKWIWLVGIATWAAMMTKGVAGAFWVPGLAAYLFWKKGWGQLFHDRQFWLTAATCFGLLIGYYVYREWDYPGFISELWKGELGGHYLRVHDGHDWPFLWYVNRLFTTRYSAWLLWIPLSWVLMWTPAGKPLRNWLVLMNCVMLFQLLIISGSSTKLEWYDVPMYAPMAMIIGVGFVVIWKEWIQSSFQQPWKQWLIGGGLVLAIWLPAYVPVFEKNAEPTYIDYPGERYGGLMKQVKRMYPDHLDYTLVYSQFSTHCLYYRLTYNQAGYEVTRAMGPEDLEAGDWVMVCEPFMWEELQKFFIIEPRTSRDGCYFAELVARLPQENS